MSTMDDTPATSTDAATGTEGDSNRFCDNQKLLVAFGGGDSRDPRDLRPEIDRTALRHIMLDAILPDAIKALAGGSTS